MIEAAEKNVIAAGTEDSKLNMGGNSGDKAARNCAVEFYRFAVACLIMLFHCSNSDWFSLKFFLGGYLGVEFFFVLSGFLLMRHYRRQPERRSAEVEAFSLFVSRWKQYFPHHFFSWCCLLVAVEFAVSPGLKARIVRAPWELTMLRFTGLDMQHGLNGVDWYLCALLIASFLLYFLLCLNESRFVYFWGPILTFGILGFLYQEHHSLGTWRQWHTFVATGLLRAIAEMSLGILCYTLFEHIQQNLNHYRYRRFICTTIEMVCFAYFVYYCWYGNGIKDFWIPFLCGILIIVTFLGEGWLARIFNNHVSAFLGKISFAFFLNQYIFIVLFSHFQKQMPQALPESVAILFSLVSNFIFSVFSAWLVKRGSKWAGTLFHRVFYMA